MTSSSRARIRVKNWSKANWDGIKQGIKNTIWPTAADNTTVEEAWDLLMTRLDELTAINVPEREFKDRGADWMTTEILQLIRKKRRMWKRARQGQNVA
jgi:hypothetical protein